MWLRPALGHVGVVRLPVRLVAPTRRQCSPRCLQGSPCSSCCRHPDWPATVNRALYHPDASSVGARLLARDTRVSVVAGSARISAPRPMRTTCLLASTVVEVRASDMVFHQAPTTWCLPPQRRRVPIAKSLYPSDRLHVLRRAGLFRPLDLLPRLERVPPHLCWLVCCLPQGYPEGYGIHHSFRRRQSQGHASEPWPSESLVPVVSYLYATMGSGSDDQPRRSRSKSDCAPL